MGNVVEMLTRTARDVSMLRKARLDAPGAVHHLIFRGIERKAIFRDTRDYETFLERFGAVLDDTRTSCHASALLPQPGMGEGRPLKLLNSIDILTSLISR